MKARFLIASLFILSASISFSQSKLIGYTYSIGVPTGSTNDYISSVSFRGVNFEGLIELNDNLAAGWLIGWNVFCEKRLNDTYIKDNVTIEGTQYRYMNLFPILARGIYQLGKKSGTRPYFGAGIGFTPDILRTDIGLYSFKQDAWHFTIAPELGINFPVSGGAITGSLRYLYGFKKLEIENISYLSLNIGFLFGGLKKN